MPDYVKMLIGFTVVLTQSFLIGYLWVLVNRKNNDELELKIDKVVTRHKLSAREKEILVQVLDYKSNREIAASFFIAEDTVKTHRRNIYKKLKVNGINMLHALVRDVNLRN